jgi:hypothetical protein
MRTYLYVGDDLPRDLTRLAISVAGLRMPILVASFGDPLDRHPLATHAGALPIDLVRVRLPGLGLPCTGTPADELAVRAAVVVLSQLIAGGQYHLVILDGIRNAVAPHLLDVTDLHRFVRVAPGLTEIAMT